MSTNHTDTNSLTHSISQQLSARDDNSGQGGNWGPVQIAAPAIVGIVLLLAITTYVIWKRRRSRSHAYGYHQVRTDWVTKMFNSRRTRQHVVHSSAPMTLADSMRTPHFRLDSTDSHTPLTDRFEFPPIPKLPDSPPPMAKRSAVRWWCFFGSRPRQIKSEEPGSRWRVDGPDGSSTGHGHTNHEEYCPRYYIGHLETPHEDPVEDGGIGATPTRPVQMSSLPDPPGSFAARTPVSTVVVLPRSNEPATQVSSGDRGLPPSHDVLHTHTLAHVPSVGETARLAGSESYMVSPPALRTAGYSSPRVFNGRELSSDSFLRAQSPMVATY